MSAKNKLLLLLCACGAAALLGFRYAGGAGPASVARLRLHGARPLTLEGAVDVPYRGTVEIFLVRNPDLLIGDSMTTGWGTEWDCMGLGGASTAEILSVWEQVRPPWRYRRVVIWAGTASLLAESESPEEIAANIGRLRAGVRDIADTVIILEPNHERGGEVVARLGAGAAVLPFRDWFLAHRAEFARDLVHLTDAGIAAVKRDILGAPAPDDPTR